MQKFSTVIFFHGVGGPRRHVSLGTFLDNFDLYGQRQEKKVAGQPRSFRYEAEILPGDEEVTHFVEFKRVIKRWGQPKVERVIRVYEAYWVPEAKANFSETHTLFWMAGRVISPIRVLRSEWRAFPAIRLLSLFKLSETYPKPGHLEKVEKLYREFENWENRTRFPKGTYSQFVDFIKSTANPNDVHNLISATSEWKRSSRQLAWYHLKRILLIIIAGASLMVLAALVGWRLTEDALILPKYFENSVGAKAAIALLAVVAAFKAIYLASRSYIFDVISWTLESERSEQFVNRDKIVKYSQNLIRKIARNSNCENITIVSHSLGSCISTEALLREGIREKVLARSGMPTFLNKVKSVFTVGSPLDLIFFFFQVDQTFSHRYNRISEEKRLSIALPPFSHGGEAGQTKIYNIWSRYDPISSSMHALRKKMSERRSAITNLEVLPASILTPISAHTSYFADPNVMALIYSSVMGAPDPTNSAAIAEFMNVHKILAERRISQAFFVPAMGVLGMSFVSPLATLSAWTLCAGVSVWIASRRLSSDYQKSFGKFLRRREVEG